MALPRLRQRQRRGVVLLLALGTLFVLSVLAISFVRIQKVERRASTSYALRTQAKLAAEAGIERSMHAINNHVVGGTINSQTADWRYYGEDANRNGVADLGEDANADGVVAFEGCQIEDATTPSLQVTGERYSGTLPVPDSAASRINKIHYRLKVIDNSNRIDLNWGTAADLGKILENLGHAIDPLDPPIKAGEGAAIISFRNARSTKRFLTPAELMEVPAISHFDYERLRPYITTDAWHDPGVLHSRKNDHTRNDPDTYKDDIFEARLVSRAPVNINYASKQVLEAILGNITASYVEDFNQVVYPNIPANPNQNNSSDPNISGGTYDSRSVVITRPEAKLLAERIVERRKPANGGSFTDWSQFLKWMSGTSIRPAVFTGSEALTFLKCDVVLANLNPNTDSQRFNPNRTWGSLNRKNAAGEYVFRGADKWDLLETDSDPGWTTEGSLLPTGNFTVTSLGRVEDRFGNVIAEYKVVATIKAYEIFRLYSQYDFEGERSSSAVATHRSDILLRGPSTKTNVDTYPEFDPKSWRISSLPSKYHIPQRIVDSSGSTTSLGTKPAIYDGQVMLATVGSPVAGSYFYLSFRPDANNSNDDLNLDAGVVTGYFGGDTVTQRSVIAPEDRYLVAGTRNSGSSITIPRFEWNTNIMPDGVMFVTRRHLYYGGGYISGRFTVTMWAKMVYETDNNRIDDLIVSPKSSSDPLYGPGFSLNGKGSHEPTLFVDFTMSGKILSFWINYDAGLSNNAQFIVQQSGGSYEWHSAFHAPALNRGVWYHFGLIAEPRLCRLVVNATENVGASGSYFSIPYISSSNWGHFYPVHKCAMAYATMDELRIFPFQRSAADVIADYLRGRYRSSGTWRSPRITWPGSPELFFLNANWTEHLPDGMSSNISMRFDIYKGGSLVGSRSFSDPSLSNNILLAGDEVRVTATLTASASVIRDTPVLDDISMTFQRGGGAQILKWETFSR